MSSLYLVEPGSQDLDTLMELVKSYYKYASMSIPDKQNERYGQAIEEAQDFQDRFPESKLLKEAERYLTLSQNNLKTISQ